MKQKIHHKQSYLPMMDFACKERLSPDRNNRLRGVRKRLLQGKVVYDDLMGRVQQEGVTLTMFRVQNVNLTNKGQIYEKNVNYAEL